MTRKRKLNSKNPKYLKENERTGPKVARKVLLGNATTRNASGKIDANSTKVAIHAVWYE